MKPIASCYVVGITGKRVGTHYFYSKKEIDEYPYELKGLRWLKGNK